jgi:hypothetical protein
MRKMLLLFCLLSAVSTVLAAQPAAPPTGWQAKVTRDLPLLGTATGS